MFGVFYEEFKNKQIEGLLYHLIYFIRRILFLVISFSLPSQEFESIQFILICFLNLFASMFIVKVKV